MPNSVRFYDSTMSGAPSLSGTAGALIGVLDGCLVDGFGSVTVNSLVVADNVATATVSAGHQFAMIGTTGPVIRIEGASPPALNGDWRITVTSSTTFTFTTTGISDQSATGTITAKRAPAVFSKAFSGTNKAAYRADDVQSTRLYLRVDDTPAQYPTLMMYETMSDVDTGTGVSTTRYFAKSSASGGTARAWRLVADQRLFYLFANADGSSWPSAMVFGDIVPYRSGDAYHSLLLGHAAASTDSHLYYVNGTQTGAELARAYSQMGGKVPSGRYSHRGCDSLGVGPFSAPNIADNAIHAWPVQVADTTARGEMPGLVCLIHSSLLADGTVWNLNQRDWLSQMTASASYRATLDLTGPWR